MDYLAASSYTRVRNFLKWSGFYGPPGIRSICINFFSFSIFVNFILLKCTD